MTAATRGQPDRGDKTAGRRRASGRARWREVKRHGSHGAHSSRSGRASGGKAGREGGERDADGHAPGEWRRGTRRSTAAGREQGEIRQR